MTGKKTKWILVYYSSYQRFGRYHPVVFQWYVNNINEALGYQNDKYI